MDEGIEWRGRRSLVNLYELIGICNGSARFKYRRAHTSLIYRLGGSIGSSMPYALISGQPRVPLFCCHEVPYVENASIKLKLIPLGWVGEGGG